MNSPSSRMISPVKKGWASFFSFLLAVSLIPTLLFAVLKLTLFSPAFYKTLLNQEKIYSQMPVYLASSITDVRLNSIEGETFRYPFTAMSNDQIALILKKVIPENYWIEQINPMVDSVVSFINLESSEIKTVLDMTPIKSNLAEEPGKQAVIQLINTYPDCTSDQINELVQSLLRSDKKIEMNSLICKPPEPYLSVVLSLLQESVGELSHLIPNEISIAGKDLQGGIAQLVRTDEYQAYIQFRKILKIAPIVSGALGIIVILLALKSIKTMFSLIGRPLIFTGLFGCLGSGVIWFFVNDTLSTLEVSQISFMKLIFSFGIAVVRQFAIISCGICAMAVFLGILLILFSRKTRKWQEN